MAMTRDKAARRLDAIAGFRDEQQRLEDLGLLGLSKADRQKIRAYHDEVLADLSGAHDLSADQASEPVHWGMRMAATAGIVALVLLGFAALDYLWPDMGNWARALVAFAVPIGFVALAEGLYAGGRSPYFTAMMAGLAALAFAGGMVVLTRQFNQPLGLKFGLFASGFAVAFGHRYNSRALAVPGLVFAGGFLAAIMSLLDGRMWMALSGRMDGIFLAGLALFVVGLFSNGLFFLGSFAAMRPAWRLAGVLLAGGGLILLGFKGHSVLGYAPSVVAVGYQGLAVFLLMAAFIAGLWKGWREVLYGALIMLGLFVASRFYDWFADSLPDVLVALGGLFLFAGFLWLWGLCAGWMRANLWGARHEADFFPLFRSFLGLSFGNVVLSCGHGRAVDVGNA